MTAETKIDLRWSVLWGVVIALSPLSGAARVGVSIVAGLGGGGVAFALLRLRRRRGGGAPLAGPLIRADTLTPAVWALLAASVALFLPTFVWLFGQYTAGIWRNGHGFFVPVAMFWFARSRLREGPGSDEASPWGIPLLLAGAALAVLDAGIRSGYVGTLGLLLALPGLSLTLLGARRTRSLAFPLGLSLFLIPLPEHLPEPLGLPTATAIATAPILDALGYAAQRHLTVFVMEGGIFNISTNCSGAATLYAAFFFALLLARGSIGWGRGVAVLLAAWPITVAINAVRAVFLFDVVDRFGQGILDTPVHGLSGIGTLLGVMLGLFLVAGRPAFWRTEP